MDRGRAAPSRYYLKTASTAQMASIKTAVPATPREGRRFVSSLNLSWSDVRTLMSERLGPVLGAVGLCVADIALIETSVVDLFAEMDRDGTIELRSPRLSIDVVLKDGELSVVSNSVSSE